MTEKVVQDEAEETQLTPASENIWYALATVAGEPTTSQDECVNINREYWNRYISSLLNRAEKRELDLLNVLKTDLKPLTKEELQILKSSLLKRGFDRLPNLSEGRIDFKGVEFPITYFVGFIFPKPISFEATKFSHKMSFKNSIFLDAADLKCSIFTSRADFRYCKFSKRINFTKTVFRGAAVFKESQFSGALQFQKSKFYGYASFQKSLFWGKTDFSKVSFFDAVNFSSASFDSSARFGNSKFKAGMYFQRTMFKSYAPEFYNAEVSEDISWEGAVFGDSKNQSLKLSERNKDAYERLALMMDRLKKHHERHMFYRLEMRARRQMEKRWSLPRFINWGYEGFSDYGYGVGRTTSLWGGNIFVGALLLSLDKSYRMATPTWENIKTGGELFRNALATSFSNAHGFLGLGRGPLKDQVETYQAANLFIPYNGLAIAQAILGAIFLFFLLLTLRNKFKMG